MRDVGSGRTGVSSTPKSLTEDRHFSHASLEARLSQSRPMQSLSLVEAPGNTGDEASP